MSETHTRFRLGRGERALCAALRSSLSRTARAHHIARAQSALVCVARYALEAKLGGARPILDLTDRTRALGPKHDRVEATAPVDSSALASIDADSAASVFARVTFALRSASAERERARLLDLCPNSDVGAFLRPYVSPEPRCSWPRLLRFLLRCAFVLRTPAGEWGLIVLSGRLGVGTGSRRTSGWSTCTWRRPQGRHSSPR